MIAAWKILFCNSICNSLFLNKPIKSNHSRIQTRCCQSRSL